MGLYKIQNTEITDGEYPKTGTLSVQTGNPWRYTVWTPNGEPIITQFVKDASEGDDVLQKPQSNYQPTLAVCNNFWADLSEESEPSDLEDPIYRLTQLSEAMFKYELLIQNRFECANVRHGLESQYPLYLNMVFLRKEIDFYLGALVKAQNLLKLESFKEKLAKVDKSLFTGHTCEDLIIEFEKMIGIGGLTSILPGGEPYGDPLINEENIDGSKVPAIWNAFLDQCGFLDLGYNLSWDSEHGLVWQGVAPSSKKNWPIEGWDSFAE